MTRIWISCPQFRISTHTDSKSHTGRGQCGCGSSKRDYVASCAPARAGFDPARAHGIVCKQQIYDYIILCTEYSGNHKRVKHYLNRSNFMLRNVKTGAINLEYMPTTEHKADGLIKGTNRCTLQACGRRPLGQQCLNTTNTIFILLYSFYFIHIYTLTNKKHWTN